MMRPVAANYGAASPQPPPPPYPPYSARPLSNAWIIVVALAVAGLVAGGVVGWGASVEMLRFAAASHVARAQNRPSPTSSATSAITASTGVVVFSEDFHDSNYGWTTGTAASGSTYTYSDGAYVAVAKGELHHFVRSPYARPLQELSALVTATQSVDSPDATGFGVTFVRGSGQSQVRYQFLVLTSGRYFIEVSSGPDSTTNFPNILKSGSAQAPGVTPITIVGACITAADGTTQLVLFVKGAEVADVTDAQAVSSTGWLSGVDIASRAIRPTTVTFTRFEVRDLGR